MRGANLCKFLLVEIIAPSALTLEILLSKVQFQTFLARRAALQPADWQFELCSPFWRVYVNECDGAYIDYGSQRLALKAKTIYVIPAWFSFRTGIRKPVVQNYIHFDFTGFPHSLLQRLFAPPITVADNTLIACACREWQRRLRANPAPSLPLFAAASTLVHAIMTQQLAALQEEQKASCFRWLQESSEIGPALQCIDQQLHHPPTNQELAELCHSSTSHFSRKFHQTVGMPPAQYSRERRIAIAARMLHEEKQSIDEIAAATGFTDRFHFTRVFKAQFGLPPAAYRHAHAL